MPGESKTWIKNWSMVNCPKTERTLDDMTFDEIFLAAKHQIAENYIYVRNAHGMRFEYS